MKTFNEKAASLDDVVVLNVSKDLPFAAKRFCGAEGLEGVHTLSAFNSTFGTDYGIQLLEGPFTGLFARSVVVLDADDNVVHTELVPSIGNESELRRRARRPRMSAHASER